MWPECWLFVDWSRGISIGGNVKYPVMWVHVSVWDKLAKEALEVLDGKGIAVEASGIGTHPIRTGAEYKL